MMRKEHSRPGYVYRGGRHMHLACIAQYDERCMSGACLEGELDGLPLGQAAGPSAELREVTHQRAARAVVEHHVDGLWALVHLGEGNGAVGVGTGGWGWVQGGGIARTHTSMRSMICA